MNPHEASNARTTSPVDSPLTPYSWRPHRMMIRSLMTFLVSLFLLTGQSLAKSGQEIDTGLAANPDQHYCWYDDTRLIMLHRARPPHGDFQTEGLYVLDVTKPTQLQQLDLSPLPASAHQQIREIRCQNQMLLFYLPAPDSALGEVYSMHLGSPPERITQSQGGRVSLTGQYLLMSRSPIPLEGSVQGKKECEASYLKPGVRVFCWDYFYGKRWPLATMVLAEYETRDKITICAEDGSIKNIPNPAMPLIGKDGKPLLYGLHLRDLTGQNGMPDLAQIQADNAKVIEAMHAADEKEDMIEMLNNELQTEMVKMPLQIGIGGTLVIFMTYWFLIRR